MNKKILSEDKRKKALNELNAIKKFLNENINLSDYGVKQGKPTQQAPPRQQINGDRIIEDELAQMPNENLEKEIGAIRKMSISAVAKLAEDPTNPLYEFFKKIWDMCDKVQMNKEKSVKTDDVSV